MYGQNYSSHYLQKETYIPYEFSPNDIQKTVHVALHIWQRADGTGNFHNDVATLERFNQIFIWINQVYSKSMGVAVPKVSYPVDSIYNSHLYFQLDNVYFYKDVSKDSSYCYSNNYGHTVKLEKLLKEKYPERTKTLNIHVFMGENAASGFSMNGAIGTFCKKTSNFGNSTGGDWWLSRHWIHELGHALDLWHTYDVNPVYQQNCNPTYKDFLYDIYDTTQVSEKGCKAKLLFKADNNNIMGGANGAKTISALQMGIMHRATVLENRYNRGFNIRDHVTGYSFTSKSIRKDETWDLSMKIYQDILIKEGVTLTVKAQIQMIPQAKIVVEPGAKLIVDGAEITYENCYQKAWKGVFCKKAGKSSALKNGEIQLINGGKLLHAKKIKEL